MRPLWRDLILKVWGGDPDLDWFNQPRNPSDPDPEGFDQSQAWKPTEIPLGDGRTLVLDFT